MKKLLYLGVLFFSWMVSSQNQALFEQGKEQYKAEKYQEAVTNWMKILNNGEHSSELYFNIANANYKLNQIGPSIYYYEKALQLSPNDGDIKNNLAFAQNARVDVIEPLPKTFFAKWDQSLSQFLTYEGWAWVAVIAIVLFTVLFLKYFFTAETRRKRLFFVTSFASIFIGLIGLWMAFRTYHKVQNDTEAIVFAEAVEIKNGPRMSDETIFMLHEGTKVQVLDQEDQWSRIKLADGKDGWIPSEAIKEL